MLGCFVSQKWRCLDASFLRNGGARMLLFSEIGVRMLLFSETGVLGCFVSQK